MINILHITPHLGGGVGRVLLNYLVHAKDNGDGAHRLACLEYANPLAETRAARHGIELHQEAWQNLPALRRKISQADIVLIHWWNHPLLNALLQGIALPPARIILWSHVSGQAAPQCFTPDLLGYPDLFVMASPYSYQTPEVQAFGSADHGERLGLVFSCAGIDHIASARPRAHKGFNIGYLGTVDYCKMHREYLAMSAAARIPEASFIVCGGPGWKTIEAEAAQRGWAERFDFRGQITDVAGALSSFDVFGYPLSPEHYGTGEQTLIEAMAVGVPPVVLANGAEQYVVDDGRTGLVAGDPQHYTRCLEMLHQKPELRLTLADQARKNARQKYTIEATAKAWDEMFTRVMKKEKRVPQWPGPQSAQARSAAQIFVASLGSRGRDYAGSMQASSLAEARSWEERIRSYHQLHKAKTRGSVFHYQSFFPNDPHLNLWCGLLAPEDEAQEYFRRAGLGLGTQRVASYMNPDSPADSGCESKTTSRSAA